MFVELDAGRWARKEIFERFSGYRYTVTADVDITELLTAVREKSLRFYPTICYCIGQVVNGDPAFRYGRVAGKLGYWDQLDLHYTVMRKNTDHLFAHAVTRYEEDFAAFHAAFLEDQQRAEDGDQLYYNNYSPLDTVHVSTMPNLRFRSLSLSKPASFSGDVAENAAFIPFVTTGKHVEENGRILLPVAVEFHHAVNDGYHAQQFFLQLEECCRRLAARLAE